MSLSSLSSSEAKIEEGDAVPFTAAPPPGFHPNNSFPPPPPPPMFAAMPPPCSYPPHALWSQQNYSTPYPTPVYNPSGFYPPMPPGAQGFHLQSNLHPQLAHYTTQLPLPHVGVDIPRREVSFYSITCYHSIYNTYSMNI